MSTAVAARTRDDEIGAFFAADPATIAWPYPMYERWREGTGVLRWEGGPATVVTHHRDQRRARVGQRQGSVVEPCAAAQSHPLPVDRKGGHQHHRRLRDRRGRQPRLGGFTQPERGLDQFAWPIPPPLQRQRDPVGALAGHGEKNGDVAPHQRVDQLQGAWLGADRDIGADGLTRFDDRRQVRGENLRLDLA